MTRFILHFKERLDRLFRVLSGKILCKPVQIGNYYFAEAKSATRNAATKAIEKY